MFPNFVNNMRESWNNFAQDVSEQSNRVRRGEDRLGFLFNGTTSHPQQQQRHGHNQRAPSASSKAIRQLPTIRVSPEDLIDPSNRECCVCLDCNQLGDRVTRLPCAHIFHTECVLDWLTNHSCTCPICRYELPTDDPQYEVGRIERMRLRKPRFAMHELKRLSVTELLALNSGPVPGGMEKRDLIQYLIDHQRVDMIQSPEPVEYDLATLRCLKIRDLKMCMEEAGVFFRPEDVVEKSDMIAIFKNSGRLVILPNLSSSHHVDSVQKSQQIGPSVETGQWSWTPMQEASSSETLSSDRSVTVLSDCRPTVETVSEDSGDDEMGQTCSTSSDSEVLFSRQKQEWNNNRTHYHAIHSTTVAAAQSVRSQMNYDTFTDLEDVAVGGISMSSIDQFTSARSAKTTSAIEPPFQHRHPSPIGRKVGSDSAGVVTELSQQVDPDDTFQHYTISHLQGLARDIDVDMSSCFERSEMVDLLVRAGIRGSDDPTHLLPVMFESWSVSIIRAVASEAKIDLSRCNGRQEMIERILFVANTERYYLREYVRSLAPLTRKSLADLRAIAKELHVDISDCLEKNEIVSRLISRSTTEKSIIR